MIRNLSKNFAVFSRHMQAEDIEAAAGRGFACIITNRPDGEAGDEIRSDAARTETLGHGMSHAYIPVSGALSEQMLAAMNEVLDKAVPSLAYCRTGMRSSRLWAAAQIYAGRMSVAEVSASAACAGYDVSGFLRSVFR